MKEQHLPPAVGLHPVHVLDHHLNLPLKGPQCHHYEGPEDGELGGKSICGRGGGGLSYLALEVCHFHSEVFFQLSYGLN
ncbi:hypothetical protein JYU34_006479 [Plutella xylostella]|uniref:Uncharacterized protein n=1 Tax=Plutella xylostella TaxID=51655 RepID=A0ABQ7QS52_PLUXY|nr:hypothetical protein JYU34_006479 [Plutella xylostella]